MPNLGFVDQVADQVTANPGAGMQPPPPGPGGPPPVIQQFMQGLSQILPGLPLARRKECNMGLSALDLTGLTSLFDFGKAIIDRVIPDPAAKLAAQQKLTEMTLNRELAVMANDTKLIELQTSINLEQAKNSNLFVSGPRPALMWVGVFGVAWQWIFLPIGTFAYTAYFGHDLPVKPPELSPDMMIMLGGLMGLQIGFRSYEKVKGAAA